MIEPVVGMKFIFNSKFIVSRTFEINAIQNDIIWLKFLDKSSMFLTKNEFMEKLNNNNLVFEFEVGTRFKSKDSVDADTFIVIDVQSTQIHWKNENKGKDGLYSLNSAKENIRLGSWTILPKNQLEPTVEMKKDKLEFELKIGMKFSTMSVLCPMGCTIYIHQIHFDKVCIKNADGSFILLNKDEFIRSIKDGKWKLVTDEPEFEFKVGMKFTNTQLKGIEYTVDSIKDECIWFSYYLFAHKMYSCFSLKTVLEYIKNKHWKIVDMNFEFKSGMKFTSIWCLGIEYTITSISRGRIDFEYMHPLDKGEIIKSCVLIKSAMDHLKNKEWKIIETTSSDATKEQKQEINRLNDIIKNQSETIHKFEGQTTVMQLKINELEEKNKRIQRDFNNHDNRNKTLATQLLKANEVIGQIGDIIKKY